MNRFRGRRKAKDDLAAPRPSMEAEPSGPFKMFGKKKSQEEEPRRELDLATALPSSDDFRTSLLMTGLSARFSMLREQDDPNTKVGKASDDSVLYPKRQSRLTDFGFGGGLDDIAEVESIRAPAFGRINSFVSSDDAASTSGSMMGRAKPTEGNNLFGGRQKIYKIPAGGASKSGGLPGRALYDDDVAQSAFQKWRQAEKDRGSFDEDRKDESHESESTRPESPSQPEYNRRRETSSTTSSGPSAARNSTAATSVTSSQPGSSAKDWQSPTAPNTSAVLPPIERSVTRTRRLYEQSLNQDLHDHQSSALSRIDTLSRQRGFGTRTPDLTPTVPSPTAGTFSERFSNSRMILSKASAPNLRSFSPPTANSPQASPIEPTSKVPILEQRSSSSFGITPPLSPPISETEEHAMLPIGPNDRGKATALGVFSKPTQQYDETRYAQRQIQLQRGRETPTDRFRPDSNGSNPVSRSRSSSAQRVPFEKRDSSVKPEPTVVEENQVSTFFDDDDDDQSVENEPARVEAAPQLTIERPNDQEHPAFRRSALPTPLSLKFKSTDGPYTIAERSESSNENSKNVSPEDSPTLGPASGLSGMVRQHLRGDSNASSVYENAPDDADLASRFPPERPHDLGLQHMGAGSNPWEPTDGDWPTSLSDGPSPTLARTPLAPTGPPPEPPSIRSSQSDVEDEKETDDFARHLADGARRVRERLTSYVESDSGKPITPTVPAAELMPPRPNALGILKSKSSRGSLIDRSRGDKDGLNQSKAKKLLGLSGPPLPVSPAPRQASFEANEEARKEDRTTTDDEGASGQERNSTDKDENVHAGLKAFRQARRELQRMKELEVQQRYQGSSQKPQTAQDQHPATRPLPQESFRSQSQERRPPPVTYNRIPSEELRNGAGSRSASRGPSERDRSGSETSSGGRSGSRPPPRMRNGSVPREEHLGPMSPPGSNGLPRGGPMNRLPGLPGHDIKRSPHMPLQGYPGGSSSPGRFGRSESAQSLNVQAPPGYEPGQPSPMSLNGGSSPYGPNGMASPHQGQRMIRTRDISEPSLSSAQASPAKLDGSLGSRSRSGSLIGAAASTPNLNGSMAAPPPSPDQPSSKEQLVGRLHASK